MAIVLASRGALDLHVVPHESQALHTADPAAADGSLRRPFTSVHAANEALRQCGGCSATVSLHPGTHVLGSRGTLQLTGEGAQRWQGLIGRNGERAILSGGAQVMGPWTEVTPGRWSAALPSGAAAKTLRIGSTRAPQATFPSATREPPKSRWLYVESVKRVAGNSYEVAVQQAAANVVKAHYHSWGNTTPRSTPM